MCFTTTIAFRITNINVFWIIIHLPWTCVQTNASRFDCMAILAYKIAPGFLYWLLESVAFLYIVISLFLIDMTDWRICNLDTKLIVRLYMSEEASHIKSYIVIQQRRLETYYYLPPMSGQHKHISWPWYSL